MIQNALTGIVLLAVFTQVFKACLQAKGITQSSKWQDPLVWLFLLVAGLGGYVLNARLDAPLTGASFKTAIALGFLAISAAIGQYSLVTHNYFNPSPDPDADTKPAVIPSGTATIAPKGTAAQTVAAKAAIVDLPPKMEGEPFSPAKSVTPSVPATPAAT